jgi:hypothetical protein
MIRILDLFEGAKAEWTVDDLRGQLGYSRTTLYRYLRVLTDAGFLTTLPGIGRSEHRARHDSRTDDGNVMGALLRQVAKPPRSRKLFCAANYFIYKLADRRAAAWREYVLCTFLHTGACSSG